MSIWDSYKSFATLPLRGFGIGQRDPAKDANKYLDKIPGVGHDAYDPFINQGREAGGILKDQYGRMLDPTKFMDDIMKNYKMSEGAMYKRDQLGKGIGNAAASGGFAGTPDHQRQYGEMADEVMSGDMDQYLQNALGIHGSGIAGEQDFYNKGFNASGSLADMLAGVLGSKSGLAFQSGTQKNANEQALMQALMKALSKGSGVSGMFG
jgi:hypothetical protein